MRALKPIAIVLATTFLTVAAAGSASAAPTRSTVTITQATGDDDGVDVRGRVGSPKALCVKRRRVLVYHDVAPPGPSEDDFLLGGAVTNDAGSWRVSTTFAPDKVYAILKQKKRRGRVICGGKISRTKNVSFDN